VNKACWSFSPNDPRAFTRLKDRRAHTKGGAGIASPRADQLLSSSDEGAPPDEPLKEGAVRHPQSGPSDRTQDPHLVQATRSASRRRGKHDRHHDHRGDSEGDHKGLPPAPAASPFGRLHVPLRSARVAAIDSVAAPGSCNAAGAAELPIEFVIYITEPRGGPGRTRDRVRDRHRADPRTHAEDVAYLDSDGTLRTDISSGSGGLPVIRLHFRPEGRDEGDVPITRLTASPWDRRVATHPARRPERSHNLERAAADPPHGGSFGQGVQRDRLDAIARRWHPDLGG
jgi:hypothetical protein